MDGRTILYLQGLFMLVVKVMCTREKLGTTHILLLGVI